MIRTDTTHEKLAAHLKHLREAGHASGEYLRGFEACVRGFPAPVSHSVGYGRGYAACERIRDEGR